MSAVSEIELLASLWTSAGNAGPSIGDERSPESLRDRIETAAATGWSGIGLSHLDIIEAKATMGLAAVSALCAEVGIRHVELEVLDQWWSDGHMREKSDRMRQDFFEAAGVLGVANIKVLSDLTGIATPAERYVSEFAALAKQAESSGTRIAIEPMPMARFATVHDAMALVDQAGEAAGGLCVDIWHVCRAGTSMEDMATALRPERIFVVELDDAFEKVQGNLWEDTVNERRYCGEGELDVTGFVDAIRNVGFDGYWGVEILSREHRATPLSTGLRRAYETTMNTLRRVPETRPA
ncbi:MAG: sugar phosphate isomerase/epimerase family protein [Rhodococcus sp. (in: high G+C Gram-positive bacteria)]